MAENRELALVLKLVADQFKDELKSAGGILGEFNKFIADWKVQLTAASTALFAITKSTANYGEELLKTSQKVGVNIEALAGMQYAANLANLSNEQLALGLKTLSQNMVEAAQRTGDGEALFFRLGVSATDAAGKIRPTEAVLLDLADVFARSADGAGKTEAAVKLFGKSGLELVPFLNQGKAGITALMDEARKLGLVMSKDDAEAANRFNDEIKKLEAGLQGVKLQIGMQLIPTMTELIALFRSLGSSSVVGTGLGALHAQIVALNLVLRELQLNSQFLFGTGKDALSFDELKARIAAIELEAKTKLFEFKHPGVLTTETSTSTDPTGDKKTINLKDQEKLGKALLELFLEQNRAIDIGFDIEVRKHAQQMLDLSETAEAQKRLDDLQGKVQEGRGKAELAYQLAIKKTAQQEGDERIENAQAWVTYFEQLGGNADDYYTHKMDLLRAQLAKELELNERQAANLLMAWQNYDADRAADILANSPASALKKETIELKTMQQSILNKNEAGGDFFAGWAEGMRHYVKDTQSGFGLAADMARRTAQLMESSFKTFFFDAMEGKIKSFKDLLTSLLDFAKQIVSQVGAQLVTRSLLSAGTNLGSSLVLSTHGPVPAVTPAGGGMLVRRFAMGGPVPGFGNQDTVPALLTPGEVVLSRRDVGDIKSGLGGVTVVVNNYAKADVQAQSGQGADGKQMLYLTIRDLTRSMFRSGEFDAAQRDRYGTAPQPFGR